METQLPKPFSVCPDPPILDVMSRKQLELSAQALGRTAKTAFVDERAELVIAPHDSAANSAD